MWVQYPSVGDEAEAGAQAGANPDGTGDAWLYRQRILSSFEYSEVDNECCPCTCGDGLPRIWRFTIAIESGVVADT